MQDQVKIDPWISFLGNPAILALIAFVAVAALCRYRTGSWYFLLDRLWMITAGKKEFSNKRLNAAWQEISDMELLRYRTRIPLYSQRDFDDLFAWCRRWSIDFHEMIGIWIGFDYLNRRFRKKAWGWAVARCYVSCLIASVSMYFFATVIDGKTAWLSVRSTGASFVFDGSRASLHPIIPEWEIGAQQCASSEEPKGADLDAICSLVVTTDKTFYEKSLKTQRTVSYVFLFASLLALIFAYTRGNRFFRCRDLQRKLQKAGWSEGA